MISILLSTPNFQFSTFIYKKVSDKLYDQFVRDLNDVVMYCYFYFLYPLSPYHNITNSHTSDTVHVNCHEPIQSANIP